MSAGRTVRGTIKYVNLESDNIRKALQIQIAASKSQRFKDDSCVIPRKKSNNQATNQTNMTISLSFITINSIVLSTLVLATMRSLWYK